MDVSDSRFLPGFAWPVVRGFRDAIASCRFEEGDLLYDSPDAYGRPWDESIRRIGFSVQVQLPKRMARSASEAGQDVTSTAFAANWASPAVVKVTEFPAQASRDITTTQGRIFAAVWHGDISILESTAPQPSVPRLSPEALPLLRAAVQHFITNEARQVSEPLVFALPYDETRNIDTGKFVRLSAGLGAHFHAQVQIHLISELGLEMVDEFVPTTGVAFFLMGSVPAQDVRSELKKQLYEPSRNRKTNVDRFNLDRHGLLADAAGPMTCAPY